MRFQQHGLVLHGRPTLKEFVTGGLGKPALRDDRPSTRVRSLFERIAVAGAYGLLEFQHDLTQRRDFPSQLTDEWLVFSRSPFSDSSQIHANGRDFG
jgi:hypothetical protein